MMQTHLPPNLLQQFWTLFPAHFRLTLHRFHFSLLSVSETFTRYYYQVVLTRKVLNINVSGQNDLSISGSAFMSISTFKRRLLAASAAALCLLGCTGPPAQRTDVWKSDSSYSRRISDPVAWSAAQFSDSPNASVADARLESFEADIDHDGVSELFITSQRLHGEAHGPYLCFRRSGP